MKQIVKTPVLITIFLCLAAVAPAQLKLPLLTGIAPDVKKVIEDYPNHFNNLQGELIIQNPQSADYACNFKAAGAEQTIITQYTSTKVIVSSWEALMLTTESFEEAKKKFKMIFGQLNNLVVKLDNTSVLHLKGSYEIPVEEKNFTSIILSFENGDETMNKLKVEVVMQYEPMDWKVKVLVYDREREDNERGVTVEE